MDAIIELTDLAVRYGRVRALDGLSLRVPRGEIYGFLGRNGAGKTTTLRVLMGIVKADGGRIELFGEPMQRVSVALKRRIGYVSQEQNFYPWMTARGLGRFAASFYPTWDRSEFARLLKVLDVPTDQRSAELSGGTRSKLALALAVAPRPDLLLLDEPTTGLDPVARREFNDLVAAIAAEYGTTAFFSSHLVDEVESIATHVGIIQAGRMRIEGRTDELRARVRRVTLPASASASASAPDAAADAATGLPSAPFVMPPGFECVREDIWQAGPDDWESAEWPPGTLIARLPLAEIFLAFARTDAPLTAAA
jgi:ABC-2 type transport system ATP-binding protein